MLRMEEAGCLLVVDFGDVSGEIGSDGSSMVAVDFFGTIRCTEEATKNLLSSRLSAFLLVREWSICS